MREKNGFDNSKVALLFLADGLPFREVPKFLDSFLKQSLSFSEIHLITAENYMNEDALSSKYEGIRIHKVEAYTQADSNWFCDILHSSNCGQLIFTTPTTTWRSKYYLERQSLQARLSGNGAFACDDLSAKTVDNTANKPFGCIDNFVFSTQWILDNKICLRGISEAHQSLFTIDVLVAIGNRDNLVNAVTRKDFEDRARKFVHTLTADTFAFGLSLCKSLFEIADSHNLPELIQAAEYMAEEFAIASAKFVSPFDEDDSQISSLLKSLEETVRSRTDLQDSGELSDKLVANLKSPLVSVIIPVYNCENEINRCLTSIYSQTLKSIEIICVNDGSEDNSLEILRNHEKAHSNLCVMTQENAGQGAARNRAIAIAKGKYISFVDGDDWIEPKMCETMAFELEHHPEAQLAKCGTFCDFCYPVSDNERRGLENYFSEPEPAGVYPTDRDKLLTGGPCDKMYSTALIKENNIRFPEGVKNEDEAFVLFCVCRASAFVLMKDKFYHYIKNMSGTMNTQAKKALSGKLPDIFDICNLLLDFLYAEKKHTYIGRIIKSTLGAADRFESSPIEDIMSHAVATLLDKAQFHRLVETVVPDRRAWCKRKAGKYLNLRYETPFVFRDLSMWLPTPKKSDTASLKEKPDITFVVPIFNAERFLIQTLDSLLNQTMRNIEIICINDGSTDRSAEILEYYESIDPRVRAITKENSGVSATRNLGIKEARGKYIAFVDGDDVIDPEMAEKCFKAATEFDLEVIAFDFECFDCASEKKLDHYWTLANRAAELPMGQVFDAESFVARPLSFYGSSCMYLWEKEFLVKNNLKFPTIKISEDLCFVVNAVSVVKRMMILPEVFYHYRRNVTGSAITSLGNTSLPDPRINTVPEMGQIIEQISNKDILPESKANIVGRLLSELRYFHKISKELEACVECEIHKYKDILESYVPLLYDGGLKAWLATVLQKQISTDLDEEKPQGVALRFPNLDKATAPLWTKIHERRKKTKHDLIVVFAFLGSETADPMDSWTFFSWLQDHDIPSRFVISKTSLFYKDLIKKKKTKDVIALEKSCLKDEHSSYFLSKLFKPLCRAKALVFEDFVWPWPLRTRFKVEDWKLVFLQHGVIYFRLSKTFKEMLTRFNYVNTSSPAEMELLTKEVGSRETSGEPYPEYVLAGLPRWDNLVQGSNENKKEKVVFIMFTWRDIFQNSSYNIRESAYFNTITALFKSSFIEDMKARGVKVVFAPHHHLLDLAPDVVKEWPVELCEQKDISYWVKNASCLVTDHSSISWDFMLQKKPVIHFALDEQDLTLGENELSQLAFVSKQVKKFATPVTSIAQLRERLFTYADNGFKLSKEDEEQIDPLFPHREGFSQRVYEKLCCNDEQKGAEK